MKRLIFLALALVLLTACASFTLSFRTMPTAMENGELSSRTSGQQADLPEGFPSSSAEPYVQALYFNEKVYETTKQQAKAYSVNGTVTAGIIPHHGTASGMIASFFETLSDCYDTVIIIGPNHFEKAGAVVYSDCGWSTPKGEISCDSEFAQRISKDLAVGAVLSNETVQNDHSIGWHLPYVADYLPDAQLAAVMLRSDADEAALKALVELIAEYAAEKKVLLIGSVDFSHYLMPDEAEQMDELTQKVIASRDYGRLMRFDSDNVDSPQTVYVVMKTVESLGCELSLLDRSISYEQAGGTVYDVDPEEGTTTYMVYGAVGD